MDRLHDAACPGALYNSFERERLDPPRCHPRTRIALLERLMDCITGHVDLEAFVMWLCGTAGAGKSAIGHTLAEICERHGYLLATFFFSQTSPGRDTVDCLIATIAYQIALAVPDAQEFMVRAIDRKPMIFEQSLETQLTELILFPLQDLCSTGFSFLDSPFFIIIDGLDECFGKDAQSLIVKTIISGIQDSGLPLRVLIISRPEIHLQRTFNTTAFQPHLSRISLSNDHASDSDIRLFLHDSFRMIKDEHPLASYIPSDWPSSEIVDDLTRNSSGQFIYVSTIIKYISDPSHLPVRRLEVVIGIRPHRNEKDRPFGEINSLYMHLLSSVNDIDETIQVLGVLLVLNPLLDQDHSIDIISRVDEFLLWSPGESLACLNQLASVITCSQEGDIHLKHPSLSEFLLDCSRSQQFYLCQSTVLANCARLCLQRLSQPKESSKPFHDTIPVC